MIGVCWNFRHWDVSTLPEQVVKNCGPAFAPGFALRITFATFEQVLMHIVAGIAEPEQKVSLFVGTWNVGNSRPVSLLSPHTEVTMYLWEFSCIVVYFRLRLAIRRRHNAELILS